MQAPILRLAAIARTRAKASRKIAARVLLDDDFPIKVGVGILQMGGTRSQNREARATIGARHRSRVEAARVVDARLNDESSRLVVRAAIVSGGTTVGKDHRLPRWTSDQIDGAGRIENGVDVGGGPRRGGSVALHGSASKVNRYARLSDILIVKLQTSLGDGVAIRRQRICRRIERISRPIPLSRIAAHKRRRVQEPPIVKNIEPHAINHRWVHGPR